MTKCEICETGELFDDDGVIACTHCRYDEPFVFVQTVGDANKALNELTEKFIEAVKRAEKGDYGMDDFDFDFDFAQISDDAKATLIKEIAKQTEDAVNRCDVIWKISPDCDCDDD